MARNKTQVELLSEVIKKMALREKGRLIGMIGAAFALIKGDNFDLDEFSRRANRVMVNFPQAVVSELAATTSFADKDISLTNEKDRFRLIVGLGQSYGDLDEATALGEGVLEQIHKLGYYQLERTGGRVDKQSGRRWSLGCEPGEQDGITTLVKAGAACRTLDAELLGSLTVEELMLRAVDAQAPDETTKLLFRGLNGVTCADSASGIQVATHQAVIDVIAA